MPGLSAREAARQRAAARAAQSRTVAEAQTRDGSGCQDMIGPALSAILECVTGQLDECGRLPGRVAFYPGSDVAHDDCCEDGGQLWVRLLSLFPSGRPFPSVDTTQPGGCGITLLGARVGVGIVRCAHSLGDDGSAPDPDQLTADTLAMTTDASQILNALTCCLPARPIMIAKMGSWTPIGPMGGCVGGEWEVQIGLDDCGCR